MPSDIRKIDPTLKLGLQELCKPGEGRGSFSFQLQYAKQQIEDILLNLDELVENTIAEAPHRTTDFCLDRTTDPPLTHEEVKWERAMHRKWGPGSSSEYTPVCKHIQTYQYPLRASREDRNWGAIDLLGIGTDLLPVPNELKRRKTNETPLRMLVEVAAYGFAIRKAWPTLKDHWARAMVSAGAQPSQLPASLDRLTLVGVAPEEYWLRALGRWPKTKAGTFPAEAWPPFWELVDTLGRWFDIHFVAVEGIWNDVGLPTIAGARLLDLRSDSGQ